MSAKIAEIAQEIIFNSETKKNTCGGIPKKFNWYTLILTYKLGRLCHMQGWCDSVHQTLFVRPNFSHTGFESSSGYPSCHPANYLSQVNNGHRLRLGGYHYYCTRGNHLRSMRASSPTPPQPPIKYTSFLKRPI